jgi:hypothetical protein
VKQRRKVLGAVGVVTALVIGAGPTYASTSSVGTHAMEQGSETVAPDEAIRIDAEASGLEAVAVEWQGAFNVLSTELQENFPDDFAQAIIGSDGSTAEISFRSSVPAAAVDMLSEIANVRVVENVGYSYADEISTVEQLTEQLQEQQSDSFLIEVLPVDQVIKVTIEGDAPPAARSSEPAVDESALPIPFSVDVEYDPALELGEAEENLDAGLALWIGGGPQCSTAFPVKRNAGPEIGLLTAGHCTPVGTYGNASRNIFTSLPFSQFTETGTNGGDMRWLWSNTMFNGKTRIQHAGTTRKFATSATPAIGSSACKYGITTGYGCSTVRSRTVLGSVQHSGDYWTVGYLTSVKSSITQGGDSGGPWFLGNTAYGIHFGTPGSGSAFTPVRHALNRVGLHLWVG